MSASTPISLLLSAALLGQPADAPPAEGAPPTEAAPPAAETSAEEPTDHTSSWDEPAPAEPAPAETSTAQTQPSSPPPPTVVVVQPPAQPPKDAPPPRRDSGAGRGLVIGGTIMTAFGGASLLFIAAPAAIVKSVALDRAEGDPLIDVESQKTHYKRARIADDVMEGGFWTGVALIGVGVPLLITGSVLRKHARREVASRLQVDPGGVTVRF